MTAAFSETTPLAGIPATLLITVWARAKASLDPSFELDDPHALKLLDRQHSAFTGLEAMPRWMQRQALLGVAIRTQLFDRRVARFLDKHPEGAVVNLGCGLDSRSLRLDNGRATWIDMDLAEPLRWRSQLLPEGPRHHQVEASILEVEHWLPRLPLSKEQAKLFICEGTLMYFDEAIVKKLLQALSAHWGNFQAYIELVGDIARGKVHPLVRAVEVQAPFLSGFRDCRSALQDMLPEAKVHGLDNLFEHRRKEWGFFRWLIALSPSMQWRLGSVMIDFSQGLS